MKYKKNTRKKVVDYERDLISYWKTNKTFEKSVEMRPKSNSYVFYDGPPFITGAPHHGTLLSSIVKDALPRYWTMKGKRVERVWGWDCHGLPAEVFTEKKLGIKDKRDIGTKISLEEYITTCRDNMVQTGSLWEDTIDRIGRWVDFKGAYKTMDKEYMESVWWAFKQLYDKGKIYEGEKVLLYCTRDATPISKAEVAMDNSYQDITDPSVYVKFSLTPESVKSLHSKSLDSRMKDINLLAWTTTPWTLNSNTALVINRSKLYYVLDVEGEVLVVAENLVDKVMKNEKHQSIKYEVLGILEGDWLVGLEYEPLFAHRGNNAHKIWHADFVTDEDGTGIAHQAPGYGEDDYVFAKANNIPFVLDTDEEGYYNEGPWKGKQIWEHNKEIAKELKEQGVVWKIDYIRHEYPHCHRCGTKLQYRAHPSWFMDIEGQRTEMLEENSSINWFPQHIKRGRFEKTVQSAPDWNLSRDRFWATAMPVWKAVDKEGTEHIKVVGSYAELKELSGIELDDYHRPWIDDVTFTIDGLKYTRIEKVLDCWFESGSMPFAQFHYPFENVDTFENSYPGDFISEYVGQVRAWFYYLHAVNVGLFEKNAFKNVIVTGSVMGSDGKKLSKSLGNYTDPNEVMDLYGADSLRFALLSSPVLSGEDVTLKDKEIGDISRKLAMVWNMYDFFTLYADVDGWEWNPPAMGVLEDPSEFCTNSLDKWIISRVHQLITEIDSAMQTYDVPQATKGILPFIDDASNWYVRRSRKRFWKSDDAADKDMAYRTLHYVLVQLARAMAPFTPFLSEQMYINLTGKESVHLEDWPEVGHVDELLLDQMESTRNYIVSGLAIRAKKGIKVRQPLRAVVIGQASPVGVEFEEIIKEELNVKNVEYRKKTEGEESVELDTTLSKALKEEGMIREVIRFVQNARKDARLEVDDRIHLSLSTESAELTSAIKNFAEVLQEETLATEVTNELQESLYETTITVDSNNLTIRLNKT